MTEHEVCCDGVVLVCRDCGMRFEPGVSDRARGGGERCPQCGLEDIATEHEPEAEAFVVRRGTKFR